MQSARLDARNAIAASNGLSVVASVTGSSNSFLQQQQHPNNSNNNNPNKKRMMTTFYQRSLPDSCVAFSSRKGRTYFESAMKYGGMKSFFILMEQHTTQSEPAYCGISTLVIVLNALSIDPGQIWKGPWRWYEERMLNCCVDLEEVKQTGITMSIFNCLANCQGLLTKIYYVDGKSSSNDEKETIEPSTVEDFRKVVREVCVEDVENKEEDNDYESSSSVNVDRVLVVSYNRKILGQTGTGHFSPIAAYDEQSDSVLIMDTARFKYGAHWVPLSLLYQAMQSIDPDSGRSRGYIMLINPNKRYNNTTMNASQGLPIPMLLRSEMKQSHERNLLREFVANTNIREITYSNIKQFCTSNGTDVNYIWRIVSPQLKPVEGDHDAIEIIQEVRTLIDKLIQVVAGEDKYSNDRDDVTNDSTCTSKCRPNFCRSISLRPEEAILVIYLACLDATTRHEILSTVEGTERAKQQLLDEAELFQFAIDSSKQLDTVI